MNFAERLGWAMEIIGGRRVPEKVKLKGKIIASSSHTTGGSGTLVILGTFHQRGYGGYNVGDILDIDFDLLQEEAPQGIGFSNLE